MTPEEIEAVGYNCREADVEIARRLGWEFPSPKFTEFGIPPVWWNVTNLLMLDHLPLDDGTTIHTRVYLVPGFTRISDVGLWLFAFALDSEWTMWTTEHDTDLDGALEDDNPRTGKWIQWHVGRGNRIVSGPYMAVTVARAFLYSGRRLPSRFSEKEAGDNVSS